MPVPPALFAWRLTAVVALGCATVEAGRLINWWGGSGKDDDPKFPAWMR